MSLTFKKCSLIHLDSLVKISKRTFVEAFEKDNYPEDFRTYVENAFNSVKIKNELEHADSFFYFVYSENSLVGYFKLNQRKAQSEDLGVTAMELERIYVIQEFQNKGFGQIILNKAIAIAQNKNKAFLWLGVWEKNLGAIKFYQRNGFIKFDTHPYFIGNDKQTDWLMRLDF